MFPAMYHRLFPALVVLASLPAPMHAQQAQRAEVVPFYGYRFGGGINVRDGRLEFADNDAYGLAVSVKLRTGVEANIVYSRQDTKLEFEPLGAGVKQEISDVAVQYIQVGGLAGPPPRGRAQPYGTVSAGVAWLDPSGSDLNDSWRFAFGLGGGAKFPMGERVVLRGQVGAWFITYGGGANVFCGSGGCSVGADASVVIQGEVLGGIGIRF